MSSEVANGTKSQSATLEKRKYVRKLLGDHEEHPNEPTGVFGLPDE